MLAVTCAACGSDMDVLVDSRETPYSGRFVELWECMSCGAEGTIRGTLDAEPEKYDRQGDVFE